MARTKKVFSEDECLRHDPDYPGIGGWWMERFPGRKFYDDWKAAEPSEVDGGDHFTRTIQIGSVVLEVVNSFDGYHVSEVRHVVPR